jgi:hypothetical protein
MAVRSTPAPQTLPPRAKRKRKAADVKDARAAQLLAEAEVHHHPPTVTKKRQAAARLSAAAARLRSEADAYDALWAMFEAGRDRGQAEADGPVAS